jgi:hypothetical protein
MFYGHVDNVSRHQIEGWAADDGAPEQPIDISILVNDRKVAQVLCDHPREDLRRTKQYGSGRHGFLFQFPEPLSEGTKARVTILFSETGAPLVRGDWLIDSEGAKGVDTAVALPDDEPVMMPAPRDARALFELLLWYDERAGLYPLLSRLDVAGQRPQQAHYSVLGTYPDRSAPMRNTRYYPRDHLNELLLGDEFQAGLLSRFAEAYSDKRRLIFVHVPKCAGTDLSNKLKTRYPWVDYNIMDTDWTTKRAMLRHLSRLAVQLRFADCLYLCGHGGLHFYMDHHLIRPIDEIFTVVRNPLEIMVSQINYVLTRFSQDSTKGEVGPDTREWLGLIGRDSLPESISKDFARDTAKVILENRTIVTPNPLCFWLAGRHADAGAALTALINSDIEITDTAHYKDWLARRWSIVSNSRDNASVKFLTLDTLSGEQQDYLREITQEDVKLHRIIENGLAATGRASVFGRELQSDWLE